MKLPQKLSETPKWKIVGAAAALAGLGAGGLLGATLGGGGNDDPVDGIKLQDRIALTDSVTSSTLKGSANVSTSSLDSPLDTQSVASVRSVNSPGTPPSPASPAPVASAPAPRPTPAPPAARPAPAPAPAPAPRPVPAPRVDSFDSPASAPSAPSAASPASVDSP